MFFVVKVMRCGVLIVSVQSFLTTICKLKFDKTLIEVSLPVVSVLRNFDDGLRLRYLNRQPFLAEAWPI